MGAIKDFAPLPASTVGGIFSGISTDSTTSARNLTPKEFAAALWLRWRITASERAVRLWCESGTLTTAPSTPGRWLIPAAELERFGSREVSA